MREKKFIHIKSNVLSPREASLVVISDDLDMLSSIAMSSDNGSARICFHKSPDDFVQRMLVTLKPDSGFPPHRQNIDAAVTYVLLSGDLTVTTFSDEGHAENTYYLSIDKGCFILNLPASKYRSSLSGYCGASFFEVAEGPFSDDLTEWLNK